MKREFLKQLFFRFSRLRRDQSGVAAVEFALTFPIMVFVTLMIFDIGRGLFIFTSINNIAAEGTRYASVRGPGSPTEVGDTEIEAFVIERAAGLDTSRMDVQISYDPVRSTGNPIDITIDYNLHFFLGPLIPGPDITIRATSRMILL